MGVAGSSCVSTPVAHWRVSKLVSEPLASASAQSGAVKFVLRFICSRFVGKTLKISGLSGDAAVRR